VIFLTVCGVFFGPRFALATIPTSRLPAAPRMRIGEVVMIPVNRSVVRQTMPGRRSNMFLRLTRSVASIPWRCSTACSPAPSPTVTCSITSAEDHVGERFADASRIVLDSGRLHWQRLSIAGRRAGAGRASSCTITAGHPFPVQLCRELARRGYRITHQYCTSTRLAEALSCGTPAIRRASRSSHSQCPTNSHGTPPYAESRMSFDMG
jgi:hypothetical protein